MERKNFQVPDGEIMKGGHLACLGCGVPIAMKLALKGLGPKTVVVVPASCYSVIDGPYPFSATGVPFVHIAIPGAAAAATGIRSGLDMVGDDESTVMVWAGDGGTYDIGFQGLSGAAERNENILYTCYDNEAYMNTGIHRSSSSPYLVWTNTTPTTDPKKVPKKRIDFIMAEHGIPYVATASIAYPDDIVRKFEKAKNIKGMRFIRILTSCPPGWKMSNDHTIKVARLAVQTRIFPLFEIEHGKMTINNIHDRRPVEEYLSLQGRFKHLSLENIQQIQKQIDTEWETLAARANIFHPVSSVQ